MCTLVLWKISDQFQYLFFIADIPEDGNYTISVNPSSNSFSTSEKRPANEKHGTVVKTSHGPTRPLTEDVYVVFYLSVVRAPRGQSRSRCNVCGRRYLLGSNLDLPTLGHRQWENSTSRYNTWTTCVQPVGASSALLLCPLCTYHCSLTCGTQARVPFLAQGFKAWHLRQDACVSADLLPEGGQPEGVNLSPGSPRACPKCDAHVASVRLPQQCQSWRQQ